VVKLEVSTELHKAAAANEEAQLNVTDGDCQHNCNYQNDSQGTEQNAQLFSVTPIHS
jgi:hypothetical protein